jgi:hypothetical protein
MPTIINNPNEVEINGVRYPLGGDGQVHPKLVSNFAPKQVIGDYSKDSDPNRSVWSIIDDQSGGIGIEDMNENLHARRSWWSSLNNEYSGHSFLPRLASTAILPTMLAITYTGSSPTDALPWSVNGTGNARYAEATNWSNAFRNRLITVTISYTLTNDAGGPGTLTFVLNDGTGDIATSSPYGAGTATVTITSKLGASASKLRLTTTLSSTGAATVSALTYSIVTSGNFSFICDFNGYTYFSKGPILYLIDKAIGNIYLEASFPATITSIIASLGSCLYVALGTTAYYYMTAAGVWAQTDVAADKIIQWDNKFFRYVAATGQLSYTATPNTASPSFTNNGLIDTGSQGTVNNLITFSDATGTDIIYAGTTMGLIAHDYTNALWLNTDLKVPTHTDNGKGMTVQNGNLYYSSGLSVYEYNPLQGTLRNIGLDSIDGLPDEYMGSVVGLFGGYGGEFYALIDTTTISSSNYSSVQKHRNGAWFPIWIDGTANEAPYFGLLSSTYAYRIWFAVGSTLYYQGLDRARRNPLKTTTNYAASGIYLSPWFDADWPVGNKLALCTRALATNTAAAITATIKYRVNKVNLDLGTGWTTHDTLVAADAGVESVVAFGSSVGTLFKTIQFRVDLATGTATITPDLLYLTLEYERVISPKWGWSLVIDCSQEYNQKSPSQLLDALKTATETQTLVTFYYKDVVKYVRVASIDGALLTGDKAYGQYSIALVEK